MPIIRSRHGHKPSRLVTPAPQSPPCAAKRDSRARRASGRRHNPPFRARQIASGRAERQPVARQGRRHHGEGIARVAAEASRVGQARNDLEKLEHRARPAMQQQQRHRVRPDTGHVQIVQVDAVDERAELRKSIEGAYERTCQQLPAARLPGPGRAAVPVSVRPQPVPRPGLPPGEPAHRLSTA